MHLSNTRGYIKTERQVMKWYVLYDSGFNMFIIYRENIMNIYIKMVNDDLGWFIGLFPQYFIVDIFLKLKISKKFSFKLWQNTHNKIYHFYYF